MSIVPLVRPVGDTRKTTAFSGLVRKGLCAAYWLTERIVHELQVRRDMRHLAEFNDHMLRDIGLARTEIESAIRHGRDDDLGR